MNHTFQPDSQALHGQLYDSPLDSSLWRLEDANGAILAYGGLIHDASAVKLKKGSYSVKALLRHPDRAQLEAVKDLPLMLRWVWSCVQNLNFFRFYVKML